MCASRMRPITAAIALFLALASPRTLVRASTPPSRPLDVVIGVDGGTESIRACCFDAYSGRVLGDACAVPYETHHPEAGWAEQHPADWYANLCRAVKGAVSSLGELECDVRAICCDTTCCSVVALSADREPLRPCLLWMDARSAPQAAKIMDVARKKAAAKSQSVLEAFPELRVNSNGEGPISAEWMLPKAMWIKENEPNVWEEAEVICEYQDYINCKLTGRMVVSSCNAAVRWHHDGWEVLQEKAGNAHRGRPMGLYRALGMEDLAEKLPKETLAMGEVIGGLTKGAARDLGLPVGTKVVQGGPDAFVGMIGLGTVRPNQICLITGSSHLHCLLTPAATSAEGTWGAYRGAPLPHLNFAEGGQSSTGSLVRWVRDVTSGDGEKLSYKVLDEEASKIPPGCDGLVALETWQGSRTPHTDPLARGAFVGLTLSHTRAHMFRAILESVCYGTRACFDALEDAAAQHQTGTDGEAKASEVVIAGGATRSELWLQLHADITGRTFLQNENSDGPLLGCAILASVGAGIHGSVDEAVANMVRHERRVEPRPEVTEAYDKLYTNAYLKMRPGIKSVVHALADLRGGVISSDDDGPATPIISPSLLASDWSDIKGEVQKCLDAGCPWLHVDVFDGVFLDSPHALTFGPQMIDSIRKRFSDRKKLIMDIHLCVDRPERYAQPMASAGATRIIFQWEAMRGDKGDALNSATAFAQLLQSLGLKCGVSINPETPVADVYALLDSGLVDLVDILAVEPGFGGQPFNPVAIDKIESLRQYREERLRPRGIDVKILCDGGISARTSSLVADAGADILVAGTALFQHSSGFDAAVRELLR